MSADRCLVDTCVFLEATDTARPHHVASRHFLQRATAPLTSAQVIREYLVVATRPVAANGLGLALDDAVTNVRSFRTMVRLVREEKAVLPALLTLLEAVPCTGKRIHDANIVATAIAHKIGRVVTLNPRDFAGFAPHVTVVAP